MRFVLDQDVDVATRAWLVQQGNEAWTAAQAGMPLATDDDLTVYATDQNAVLVTHDREFSQRRRRNVVGRHIWLQCDEWDAVELLERDWSAVFTALEREVDLWIHLRRSMKPAYSRKWE